MAITLQQIINSPNSIRLVSLLGRGLPLRLGYKLADIVGDIIASRRKSLIVQGVRINQWVARGEHLDKDALELAVRQTLHTTARSIFNLHHFISNPEATRRMIALDPLTQQLARRAEFEEQGLMVVGVHLSNFDLVMQYLCMQGIQPLALTIPDPQGGRIKEFEMRRKAGVNLVPASVNAYRQALRHLQHGGMVVTGIDRPIPAPPVRPLFFGRPASLPMHHIFMALKAQVPVVLITSCLQPDGITRVVTTEPIELERHPDRDIEALRNAEKVLSVAEGIIRTYPQQWSMSLPVWPELLGQVP